MITQSTTNEVKDVDWNEMFYIDGKDLKWKRGNNRNVIAGDIAGQIRSGYRVIRLSDKTDIYAHRVAYELSNGKIPDGMQVDHINHDRLDNSPENLRLATALDNSRNKSVSKSSKTGVPGVTWHSTHKKWAASISVMRKRIHLGYFDDIDFAIKARLEENIKYGFHENHGR